MVVNDAVGRIHRQRVLVAHARGHGDRRLPAPHVLREERVVVLPFTAGDRAVVHILRYRLPSRKPVPLIDETRPVKQRIQRLRAVAVARRRTREVHRVEHRFRRVEVRLEAQRQRRHVDRVGQPVGQVRVVRAERESVRALQPVERSDTVTFGVLRSSGRVRVARRARAVKPEAQRLEVEPALVVEHRRARVGEEADRRPGPAAAHFVDDRGGDRRPQRDRRGRPVRRLIAERREARERLVRAVQRVRRVVEPLPVVRTPAGGSSASGSP